jgi:hypothetical protein
MKTRKLMQRIIDFPFVASVELSMSNPRLPHQSPWCASVTYTNGNGSSILGSSPKIVLMLLYDRVKANGKAT